MRFPQPLIPVMSVAIALSGLGAVGRGPRAIAQLPACAPPSGWGISRLSATSTESGLK